MRPHKVHVWRAHHKSFEIVSNTSSVDSSVKEARIMEGDLYDHLITHRVFTSTMNKISIRAPKIMTQVATGMIGCAKNSSCTSNSCVSYPTRSGCREEKCLFKIRLPWRNNWAIRWSPFHSGIVWESAPLVASTNEKRTSGFHSISNEVQVVPENNIFVV